MTKFGVNGFTEALRQEVTKPHVRVGVLEPGGVITRARLPQHRDGSGGDRRLLRHHKALAPEDIADGITYMVTRPRHASIGELWIMPTDQV
jgi:NADP-dependent 3-hydroxy acid dehydrogenase YdfG